MKKRVLFVCVHNAARSQMAEAFLNTIAGDVFEAESAGIEPGELNPLVVEAMKESGIDISGNSAKGVLEMLEAGREYDYVITVCDESQAEKCPAFPGGGGKIHWGFDDPSKFTGDRGEKLEKTKIVRDQIKNRIEKWLRETL